MNNVDFKVGDKILRTAETSGFFTKGKRYRIAGFNSRKNMFRLYDDFDEHTPHYYSIEKLREDFVVVSGGTDV